MNHRHRLRRKQLTRSACSHSAANCVPVFSADSIALHSPIATLAWRVHPAGHASERSETAYEIRNLNRMKGLPHTKEESPCPSRQHGVIKPALNRARDAQSIPPRAIKCRSFGLPKEREQFVCALRNPSGARSSVGRLVRTPMELTFAVRISAVFSGALSRFTLRLWNVASDRRRWLPRN